MLICPGCRQRMGMEARGRVRTWSCAGCGSHAATLAVLRPLARPGTLEGFWEEVWKGRGRPGRPCPSCKGQMLAVTRVVDQVTLELDGCRSCQLFWFDQGELRALHPTMPAGTPVAPAVECPEVDASRQRYAGRATTAYDGETVPEGWLFAAGMLGLPVEVDIPEVRIRPWATWILAAGMAVGAGFTLEHGLAAVAGGWGLVPDALLRKGGLTLFTSFFLHGGVLHFISNLYFLLVFGDNVEEALGWRRYLALVGLSTLAGGLVHALLAPDPAVPCIGASGGISGILACYALRYPKGQIAILGFFLFWIRIPVIAGFGIWLAMQLWLVIRQSAEETNISALAHLGGLLAGLGVWALWLRERKEP